MAEEWLLLVSALKCSVFLSCNRGEDWLMRFQISQYLVMHMLLDRSISSESKARIFRRDLRLTRFKDPTGFFFFLS